jgi:TRAP-type mannitol/chloroaromatic compound transport system substrate-binding protein
MKRLSPVSLLAVLVAALSLAACGDRESATQTPAGDAEAPVRPVQLNMASVFPLSLPLLGEAATRFTERIEHVSGGEIRIRAFEPGALVPGLESIQAVSRGSVDTAWSTPGFFAGTDSAFSFFTAVPFGPDIPELMAWMYHGGGLQLQNEMFARHNLKAIPCGVTPPEASGWFRKEINTLQDLRGLKMRFFGLGAKTMEKLGVATQLLAPGDIFQALQLGTIDAAEFANPSLDEHLGFYQVAKYYYFPGWHQPVSILNFFINMGVWESLSDRQKSFVEVTCSESLLRIMAQGEATQWPAMKRMRDQHGVQLKRWPPEILDAIEKAWLQVAAEESARNPNFRRAYESYSKFREEYAIWKEYGYVN